MRLDLLQAFSMAELCRFTPLCPDLFVELASPGDEGPRGVSALRQKWTLIRPTALGWVGCF